MSESMRDWPHKLKVNATAVEALAPCLYLSRCAVYGPPLPCMRFEDLSNSSKQAYIEIASRMLDALRPDPKEELELSALDLVRRMVAVQP